MSAFPAIDALSVSPTDLKHRPELIRLLGDPENALILSVYTKYWDAEIAAIRWVGVGMASVPVVANTSTSSSLVPSHQP